MNGINGLMNKILNQISRVQPERASAATQGFKHRGNCGRMAILLTLVCAAILPSHVFAQNTDKKKTPPVPENRWLLIMNTSKGMKSRADASVRSAVDLIL